MAKFLLQVGENVLRACVSVMSSCRVLRGLPRCDREALVRPLLLPSLTYAHSRHGRYAEKSARRQARIERDIEEDLARNRLKQTGRAHPFQGRLGKVRSAVRGARDIGLFA